MKLLKVGGYILAGLQLVFSALLLYLLVSSKMLTPALTGLAALVLILMLVLVIFLATKKKKGTRIAAIIISIICSIIIVMGAYYMAVTVKALQNMTGVTTQVDEINVYVAKDDPVNSINDAMEKSYTFGIVSTDDEEHIKDTVSKIESDLGTTVPTKQYESVVELATGFTNGEIQAFITTAGTLAVLEGTSEEYENYASNFKIIMAHEIVEEISTEEETSSSDKDHFCVYLSGIDTFGSVNVKSRSDVNIVAVVNNTTKQILLISTPRDYYVPLSISNGKKDKLTHAGLYGIECSAETLEMLYEEDINYYVRVNFTGFQNIINQIGGIDVESEYAFTGITEEGTYYFNQGVNHLTGEQALGFARERHAFKDGDRQRGSNQMQVIKATISKLESPDTLKNYSKIMDSIEGAFQTDLTTDEIGYLVQSTLSDGNWEVLTYSVSGSDSQNSCYSTGSQQLYVMEPNTSDVELAVELVDRIKNDETLTQSEIDNYVSSKGNEDKIDDSMVNQDGEE